MYILDNSYSHFTDPIDCVKDTCHLAWLIHDKPKMLRKSILHGAVCSNGTHFEKLSPNGFKRCYVILKTILYKLFSIQVISIILFSLS